MSCLLINLAETIKDNWRFLTILLTLVGSLVTGAAYISKAAVWIGRVDSHVGRGENKIHEFDRSQIEKAALTAQVQALTDKIHTFQTETNAKLDEIKKQNQRIENRLIRGRP